MVYKPPYPCVQAKVNQPITYAQTERWKASYETRKNQELMIDYFEK